MKHGSFTYLMTQLIRIQMNLTKFAKEVYERAKGRGFHQNKDADNLGTMLMLIVSELGECLDADRKSRWVDKNKNTANWKHLNDTEFKQWFEANVKDTVEDELADALIRIADTAGRCDMDLQTHVDMKMRYNELRPHKHGDKNY